MRYMFSFDFWSTPPVDKSANETLTAREAGLDDGPTGRIFDLVRHDAFAPHVVCEDVEDVRRGGKLHVLRMPDRDRAHVPTP
eukprot:7072936-Heterocapsa_arctica.AAC.1